MVSELFWMHLNEGLEKTNEALDGGLSKVLISPGETQVLNKLVQTPACRRRVKKLDDGHLLLQHLVGKVPKWETFTLPLEGSMKTGLRLGFP